MARTVSTGSTFEQWRQNYNDLAADVGDPTALTTGAKDSLVNAINYIQDQYFFFQDFDFDGSDGASSNTVFSGADNSGITLQYMASKVLVYKNGLLLRSGTDYVAVNGTSVTLTSSANNGDVVRISSYTGSYTTAPAGQESLFNWQINGANIYNSNTGSTSGIVFNADADNVGELVTAPTVANSIQFNGDTYHNNDVYLNAQKDLRFRDADSSHYIAIQAPATISSNVTLTLPADDGTSGQFLETNGSGVLTWGTETTYTAGSGLTLSGTAFSVTNEGITGAHILDNTVTADELAVSGDGGNGYALTSDADGTFSWTQFSGSDTTYTTSWVDSSANAILRLTPSSGSVDDLTIVAGSGITVTPSGDNLTIAATAGVPTVITVADTTDTTSFVSLFESATGDIGPKTDAGITYNAGTGVLTATGFAGPITGNVTGNVAGTLTGTVATSTQASITSAANLVTVGTIGTGVWQGTAIAQGYIAADAINGSKIADDSINSEHYVDGSIDTAHIADSQITQAKMASNAVTLGVLDAGMIQLSSESFADNNTSLMTSAAIQDKILAYGYTTETGDITGVTAGSGMSGGGTSGTVTLTNAGVTSIVAGSNVSISGATGAVTVTATDTNTTYSVGDGGLTQINFTSADNSKLDGIEASADVTDSTNVSSAGALMKSGGAMTGAITTNSTFDGIDIATRDAVLTSTTTTAAAALPKGGGAMTGAITTNSTFDGRNVSVDGSKLDGIEASATADQTTVSGNAGSATQVNLIDNSTYNGNRAILTGPATSGNGVINWQNSVSIHPSLGKLTATSFSGALAITDTSDTTCFVGLFEGATGNEAPKTCDEILVNASTGALRSVQLGVGVAANGTDGRIDASNDIVAFSSSDIALKENINPITDALAKVLSLGGYTFDWKKEREEEHGYTGSDIGVLAQEVEDVLPTAVRDNCYGNKSVRYEKLIPLLIESIKELKNEIESLKDSKT